ncbi:hypothetical protein SDC9_78733 [bioreactor metagenome]|uniref:Uncharacterized protein n=1 Tax=bioreactor metagenome TaxID=1076179 RepID=A0A644Z1X9_9ZZZZ
MKFCPHCGASLCGDAASFCPECGKPLTQRRAPAKVRGPGPSKASTSTPRRGAQRPPKNPMDESYDGYYDDVPTMDADRVGEGLDPALLKRILLLILGAVAIIVLAAVLMRLL